MLSTDRRSPRKGNDPAAQAPIAAFYFIYVFGIVMLAVGPALQAGSLLTATGDDGLLDLVSYATYYLTNLGTIRGWPASLTAINVIWGSFSTSISASVAYFAVTHCRIIL
jgi:uncharacterized membrane protein